MSSAFSEKKTELFRTLDIVETEQGERGREGDRDWERLSTL
jgi:hypothetical protein